MSISKVQKQPDRVREQRSGLQSKSPLTGDRAKQVSIGLGGGGGRDRGGGGEVKKKKKRRKKKESSSFALHFSSCLLKADA